MFYPDNARELRDLIGQSFRNQRFGPGRTPSTTSTSTDKQHKIYGIVSPHAGYVYSGMVAANGFYKISSTDFQDIIMAGPNHYGIGSWVAAMKDGIWETPLGNVQVNSQMAEEIGGRSSTLDFDDYAHSRDHCLEVQLPFLQYIKQDFKIVPVVLVSQKRDIAFDLGNAISETIMEKDSLNSTLLLASSDFTHYEPNSEAHRKDGELIKTILALDVNSKETWCYEGRTAKVCYKRRHYRRHKRSSRILFDSVHIGLLTTTANFLLCVCLQTIHKKRLLTPYYPWMFL